MTGDIRTWLIFPFETLEIKFYISQQKKADLYILSMCNTNSALPQFSNVLAVISFLPVLVEEERSETSLKSNKMLIC